MASSSNQPVQTRDTAQGRLNDGLRHGARGRSRRRITAIEQRDYADTVSFYSQLAVPRSLYTGSHFNNLSEYLQLPFSIRAPDLVPKTITSDEDDESFNFVTFYNLDPRSDQRLEHLRSPQDFAAKAKSLQSSAHGRLIFMRGCPTPEWLLVIGCAYQVDPEFFRRHLDFRQSIRSHYSQPSLPSTLTTAVRLQITTIGASTTKAKTDSEQATLEALREESRSELKRYLEKQRNLAGMKLGSPIIRDCAIFDLQHFCIAQDISLYADKCDSGGWFALIWLDASAGLKAGSTAWAASPLRTASWTVSSVPVIQHVPGLALRSKAKLLVVPEDNGNGSAESNNQSACFLHLNYGYDLDKELAAGDCLYALQDIFKFAASSENQFLNMLETKLLEELDHSRLVQQTNPTLSNLLYSQQVLDRHIQDIRDAMASFRLPHTLAWPKTATSTEKQQKAHDALRDLSCDYEYLLARAQALSERCSRGMQVVMNNAAIKESREAMAQAAGVVRLTRLAFVFIPLSFTASFFGMNFVQIVDGRLQLWIWFAVSLPVLFISVLFMDRSTPRSVWRLLITGGHAMTKTKPNIDRSGV